MFSYEFCEVFKNTFTLEHLWYMLLDFPKALTENPEKVKRTTRGLLSLTYSESRLLSLRKIQNSYYKFKNTYSKLTIETPEQGVKNAQS